MNLLGSSLPAHASVLMLVTNSLQRESRLAHCTWDASNYQAFQASSRLSLVPSATPGHSYSSSRLGRLAFAIGAFFLRFISSGHDSIISVASAQDRSCVGEFAYECAVARVRLSLRVMVNSV